MYYVGSGVLRSLTIGRRWLDVALEHDLPQAQNFNGSLYRDGRGVPRDATTAASWFRRAAAGGEPLGLQNLGLAYLQGEGVDRNVDEGERLLTRSAQLGLAQSQFALGQLYTHKKFDREDLERAYAWLSLCNDQRVEQCRVAFEKLESTLDAGQLARGKQLIEQLRRPTDSIR